MKIIEKLLILSICLIFTPALVVNAENEYLSVSDAYSDISFDSTIKEPNNYQIEEDLFKHSLINERDLIDESNSDNDVISSLKNTVNDRSEYGISVWNETDYISQQNGYKLYYSDLDEGQYFQARLTVPNDTSVDYDLVLYDSNF